MVRLLNVGILQMPVSKSLEENQAYIAAQLEAMMAGYHKPELVVGVEWGSAVAGAVGPIPGPAEAATIIPQAPFFAKSRHILQKRRSPTGERPLAQSLSVPCRAGAQPGKNSLLILAISSESIS